MLNHGDAIKKLWVGQCDIYVREYGVNDSGVNEPREVLKFKGQPCRLSFYSALNSAITSPSGSGASETHQNIKLFLDSDIQIPEGSKIIVTQNGRTTAYCQSSPPLVYAFHQEICLKLFKEWA